MEEKAESVMFNLLIEHLETLSERLNNTNNHDEYLAEIKRIKIALSFMEDFMEHEMRELAPHYALMVIDNARLSVAIHNSK